MNQVIDITKNKEYPTVPLFEIVPIDTKHILILKRSDKTKTNLIIIGYEKVECIVLSIPVSIEKLISKYPEMTHFYIIQEPENEKDYKEYIGKETLIATGP